MNMNQAAHGDRDMVSSGAGCVWRQVVRFVSAQKNHAGKTRAWAARRAAWGDWQTGVCPLRGNMREVAVTDGDKVSAQIKFGFSVNSYGVGDLVKLVNEATEKGNWTRSSKLTGRYEISADLKKKAASATNLFAKPPPIELGLRGVFWKAEISRASPRR